MLSLALAKGQLGRTPSDDTAPTWANQKEKGKKPEPETQLETLPKPLPAFSPYSGCCACAGGARASPGWVEWSWGVPALLGCRMWVWGRTVLGTAVASPPKHTVQEGSGCGLQLVALSPAHHPRAGASPHLPAAPRPCSTSPGAPGCTQRAETLLVTMCSTLCPRSTAAPHPGTLLPTSTRPSPAPPSPGRGAQSGEPRVPSAGAQVAAETRHLLSHLRGPCRRCCIFRTRFLPPTCSPEPPFGFLTSCFSLADSSWGAQTPALRGPAGGRRDGLHRGVTPSAEKVGAMLQL